MSTNYEEALNILSDTYAVTPSVTTEYTTFAVVDRIINIPLNTFMTIQGDANSRVIKFNFDQYLDGVDLSTKKIRVCYINALLQKDFEEIPSSDITTDGTTLSFIWTIPSKVSSVSGTVSLKVDVYEYDENAVSDPESEYLIYRWQTTTALLTVAPTFRVTQTATDVDYTNEITFYNENDNLDVFTMASANTPITVSDRSLVVPSTLSRKLLQYDTRSRIIPFTMSRYYDNVDLSTKTICIKFMRKDGKGGRASISNFTKTDTTISFSWIITGEATYVVGDLVYAIEVLGYNEKLLFMVMSTFTDKFVVIENLKVDATIVEPTPSWIQTWEIEWGEKLKTAQTIIDDTFATLSSAQQQSSEIVLARGSEASLKGRLDKDYNTVTLQLAEKATQAEVDSINARTANIIAHNGDGTKDTEIIDSRGKKLTLGTRLNSMSDQIDLGDKLETPRLIDLAYGYNKIEILENGDLKQINISDYLYNMCTIDCNDLIFTLYGETWVVLGGTENKYIAIRINNIGILNISEITNKTTVTTILSQTAWPGSAVTVEVKLNGFVYDFYTNGTKVYTLDVGNNSLFNSTYSYIKTEKALGFMLLQSKGESAIFAKNVTINRKISVGSVISDINEAMSTIENNISINKELQYPISSDFILGASRITLSNTGLLTQTSVSDYLYNSCMLSDTDYIKFNKISTDFWIVLGGTEEKYIAININNGSIKNIVQISSKTTITVIKSQTAWSGTGTIYEIKLINGIYDFYVDGSKIYSLDIANDALFSSTYSYVKTQLRLGFILLQTKGTNYAIVDKLQFDKLITISEKVSQLSTYLHSTYKGKYLSIIGDSISTYTGYIPSGNAVFYTGSNCGVTSVYDTWWMKLLMAFEMNLCVNNSWSGSYVTTVGGDVSAGCMTRCQNLHTTNHNPDVIIVYIGINDFMNEVVLGSYDGSQTFPTDTTKFKEAYAIMLSKILTTYPQSEVWCTTLPTIERNGSIGFPEINDSGIMLETWNNSIRELANLFGLKVLEHSKCGMTYFNRSIYAGDYGSAGADKSLHPNAAGHSLIANNDIRQIDNAVRVRY